MTQDILPLETAFSITSTLALAGWIVLILLPRGGTRLGAIPRLAVPGILAVFYTAYVVPALVAGGTGGGFGSLEGVKALMASDPAILAGWIHYLAFDLLVGTLIADRADEIGMNRLVQAPILLCTFMLGPLGFLVFLIVRPAFSRNAGR